MRTETMLLNQRNKISSIHHQQRADKIGPRTEPCWTPQTSCTKGDLYTIHATSDALWPFVKIGMEPGRTGPSNPKVTCNRRHKIPWSTVSKAADRSKRTRAATSPLSTASRSDMTRRTAVFVEWPGRKPDWRNGKRSITLELPCHNPLKKLRQHSIKIGRYDWASMASRLKPTH